MNKEIISSFFTSCLIHFLLLVTLFTLGQKAARKAENELKISEVAYLTKTEIERISGKIRQIRRHKPKPESLLAFAKQHPKGELTELMEFKETLKIGKPAAKAMNSKLLQDRILARQKSFVPELASEVRDSLSIQERQPFPDEAVTPRQIAKGGYLQGKTEIPETTMPVFEVEEKVSESDNLQDAVVIPVQGSLIVEESGKTSLPLREKPGEREIAGGGYILKGQAREVATKVAKPILEINEFKSRQLGGLETGGEEHGTNSVQRASFQIQGPISAREVIHSVVPFYPHWAIEKGIEPALTLRFAVLPNGKVKDAISIIRTSGYPELDKSAIDALKKWEFKPLSKNSPWREEWGEVTFIFSLK